MLTGYTVKSVQSKFKYHDELRESVLHEINETTEVDQFDERVGDEPYFKTDYSSISKLDWYNCQDYENRAWVNIIEEKLNDQFDEMASELGYQRTVIEQLWFQQYNLNDTHRWHIHDHSYTGVYYLEFPEGAPATEIVDHDNNSYTVDAKEGDVIIFPSILVHRAPRVTTPLRKTIISFNIRFEGIAQDNQ